MGEAGGGEIVRQRPIRGCRALHARKRGHWRPANGRAKMRRMARRGDELRKHVLQVARGVFLEMGFERASMDEVASRAETTKRSLYAHFESKEKLFLAVIERMRGRFLEPTESARGLFVQARRGTRAVLRPLPRE